MSENNDGAFFLLLSLGSILTSICILIYQVFVWLKDGVWQKLDILSLLTWMSNGANADGLSNWVLWPQEWIGIHKVFDFIPLTVFTLAVGLILLWVSIMRIEG